MGQFIFYFFSSKKYILLKRSSAVVVAQRSGCHNPVIVTIPILKYCNIYVVF